MNALHSDDKAQQILTAVRNLLARNGYVGTTISLVAQEAGVSRGLLHYYFKNKEEMLARVLEANMTASLILVRAIFTQSDSAQALATGLTQALRRTLQDDPVFFHLFFEGWAIARQSDIVDQRLKSLYGKFRMAIAEGLQAAKTKGIIHPTIPLPDLAALLTGIIDGLGLQAVTEDELLNSTSLWRSAENAILMLLGDSG